MDFLVGSLRLFAGTINPSRFVTMSIQERILFLAPCVYLVPRTGDVFPKFLLSRKILHPGWSRKRQARTHYRNTHAIYICQNNNSQPTQISCITTIRWKQMLIHWFSAFTLLRILTMVTSRGRASWDDGRTKGVSLISKQVRTILPLLSKAHRFRLSLALITFSRWHRIRHYIFLMLNKNILGSKINQTEVLTLVKMALKSVDHSPNSPCFNLTISSKLIFFIGP